MNKTFAALAIAGLSFSSVADAATKTYLQGTATTITQTTIDLEKANGVGSRKVTNLLTGKVTSSKVRVSAVVDQLTDDDVAVELNIDGARVYKIQASDQDSAGGEPSNRVITDAVFKASLAVEAKKKALNAKRLKASTTRQAALEASTLLNETIQDTYAQYEEALQILNENGAQDVAEAIVAVFLAEGDLSKDQPALVLDSDPAEYVVSKSLASQLKDRKNDLAKAKRDKIPLEEIAVIESSITDLNNSINEGIVALADAKKTLADIEKEFDSTTAKETLSPSELASVKSAKAVLNKARAQWLSYPPQLVRVADALKKANEAYNAVSTEYQAVKAENWKVTNAFLSVSQADDDKSIIAVLQPLNGGKPVTYVGPGLTAEQNMFAVGPKGYTFSFVGTAARVNGVTVDEANLTVGIASNKQTFFSQDGTELAQLTKSAGGEGLALDSSSIIYRLKNGRLLTNGTQLQDGSEVIYEFGSSIANKLSLKLGLFSGTVGKQTVVGLAGTFDQLPVIFIGNDTYDTSPVAEPTTEDTTTEG